VLSPPPPAPAMPKRLPAPDDPVQWVTRLTKSEAKAIEELAFHAGLTVSSFLRTLCVEASESPRQAKWKAVAARLAEGTAEAVVKQPGRKPKKGK
jgi:hypothetical protein